MCIKYFVLTTSKLQGLVLHFLCKKKKKERKGSRITALLQPAGRSDTELTFEPWRSSGLHCFFVDLVDKKLINGLIPSAPTLLTWPPAWQNFILGLTVFCAANWDSDDVVFFKKGSRLTSSLAAFLLGDFCLDSERDFPRDLSFSLSFSRSLSRLLSRSLPFLSLSVSGDACLSKVSAVNQQRRCVQRFRTGGGATYRLVASLLGLLLVLLGLFIASLCFAEQKMSVNVSGGGSSSHQSSWLTRLAAGRALRRRLGLWPLLLLVVLLLLRLGALSETMTTQWEGAPCRWRERAVTERPVGRTDRERERFLWCFLDFLECFLVLEWWCWHSCCSDGRRETRKVRSRYSITEAEESRFHCECKPTSKTCMKSLNIRFLSASKVTSSKADSFKNLSLTCKPKELQL